MVTLQPMAYYSGAPQSIVIMVALVVALIPTTIGALLSAIGIAGMDRLVQRNVLAMSGRAVEAAGDVNTLLLDKTGTITIGNRQASEFLPVNGVSVEELADAAQLSSLADYTPEGRSIVVLAKEQFGLRERSEGELPGAEFVEFTAQTRMSGVDLHDGRQVRKGASSAVREWVRDVRRHPAAGARRDGGRHLRRRRHAAGRGGDSTTAPHGRSASSTSRTSSRKASASGSPNCARWASAR